MEKVVVGKEMFVAISESLETEKISELHEFAMYSGMKALVSSTDPQDRKYNLLILKEKNEIKFSFNECKFVDDVVLRNLQEINSLVSLMFRNCIFDKMIYFSDLKINSIIIDNCQTEGTFQAERLEFIKGSVTQTFNILYSHFNSFYFVGNKNLNTLSIFNSKFSSKFTINSSNIECFHFFDSQIKEGMISGKYLGAGSVESKNYPYADNCDAIKMIYLRGILINSNILFSELNLAGLSFSNFTNKSDLKFQNIDFSKSSKSDITSFCLIEKSDLGKTFFTNINFVNVERLAISQSSITEIVTNAVRWNYNVYAEIYIANRSINAKKKKAKYETPKIYYEQVRDAYRQLRSLTEKQGDRFEALKFQAKEIEAHWNSIKFKENPGDWITIFFGFANVHGQSWVLPLFGLIICSFLLYGSINLLLGAKFYIGVPDVTYWDGWLKFINPSKFEIQLNSKAGNIRNGISVILFLFWKVLSVTLIYQTVVAFRKFTRKL